MQYIFAFRESLGTRLHGSLLDPCNFHTIHSTIDRNGPGNRARKRLASMVLVSCNMKYTNSLLKAMLLPYIAKV